MIGTSFVTIVISAAINDPVASVPMNESIRMTTTTTALITPIADAHAERDRDRRDDRNPVLGDQVRDDDARERHDEGEGQVEDARRERDRDRQRGERGDRVGVEDLLGGREVRERLGTQSENTTTIPSQT